MFERFLPKKFEFDAAYFNDSALFKHGPWRKLTDINININVEDELNSDCRCAVINNALLNDIFYVTAYRMQTGRILTYTREDILKTVSGVNRDIVDIILTAIDTNNIGTISTDTRTVAYGISRITKDHEGSYAFTPDIQRSYQYLKFLSNSLQLPITHFEKVSRIKEADNYTTIISDIANYSYLIVSQSVATELADYRMDKECANRIVGAAMEYKDLIERIK